MTRTARPRRARAAALALAAAAALAVLASTDARATPVGMGGFACGYTLTNRAGGVEFEGQIASDRPISGTYEVRVFQRAARGLALVNTSGSFTAALGSPATTGTILFGAGHGWYDVQMVLRINGKRWPCAQIGSDL